ncbi:MAG: methyltransferase [Acidobacteriaceae bacterium]|nr:methyltransferase [Acidobacteriaceae bacterium]
MSTLTTAPTLSPTVNSAVFYEAHTGLTAPRKTLSPWLFYDEAGSQLFERITQLPEYYLTRTERAIFAAHADEIIQRAADSVTHPAPALTLIELGAGTATKTGILLTATVRRQGGVVYQPVDVSESALAEASENILSNIPGVTVRCQVADYTREPLPLDRLPNTRTLALYIGSSIGNFAPADAIEVLANLRAQLQPGDRLLLGTDLAPGTHKTTEDLLSAYNDAAGTTAAFNLNVLTRLNRDLGANFKIANFRHQACWNPHESRIEMHLEATQSHTVTIPGISSLHFSQGETIHTENSYKFTPQAIAALLDSSGFTSTQTWNDPQALFAVTLATAV